MSLRRLARRLADAFDLPLDEPYGDTPTPAGVRRRLLPRDAGADTVCASFEFGAGLANPLVRALPPMVLIALAELPRLDAALKILFDEAAQRHCGRQAVLDRLSEVVIIQLLRELMDQQRFA